MKRQFSTSELPRHWNRVALRLSAIPGLGQLYKGHLAEALFLMLSTLGVLMWLGTLLCNNFVGIFNARRGHSLLRGIARRLSLASPTPISSTSMRKGRALW